MPALLYRLLLLLPLLWLAGCATVPDDPRAPAPTDELAGALQAGDCRAAFSRMDMGVAAGADRRLQVGQVCLQSGDFVRARQAAAAFLAERPNHPDTDYAAYLHALAGFGEWVRAGRANPEARIREGRALGREVATYLRERPMSEYAEDLAPRMVRLREGIADAEMTLAEQAHNRGDRSLAQARAEYVLQHYPRTQAAADAARLLMTLAAQ
nr:outer membrane protein assembly factor BamD [Thioalkalivibrio sp.]